MRAGHDLSFSPWAFSASGVWEMGLSVIVMLGGSQDVTPIKGERCGPSDPCSYGRRRERKSDKMESDPPWASPDLPELESPPNSPA